ncbi:TPA: NADH-quinone oxidoreductase subunit N [Candidatus Poribacteria bacterium]|nr:NADH-quinone oxidoreductase subunit N [Candidatus Poribacteria bacterium]
METLDNIQSVSKFIPELILIVFAIAVVISDFFAKGRRETLAIIALVGLIATLISVLAVSIGETGESLFMGMIKLDSFALFFKVLFIIATFATILFSVRLKEIADVHRGEYYALLLTVTLGMFLLASATNLLMIYLSLELVSISSYILSGFSTLKPQRSSETSFKFIIYGAVSSGIMLFGISLLFGMTGISNINDIGIILAGKASSPGEVYNLTILLSILFILAGIGYKTASVPFHQWAPDVYEGAPTPITAFLSVASKAAGFSLLLRFLYSAFAQPVAEGWSHIGEVNWPLILGIISALTMTVGNLSALLQNNLKRLLAYSSIAHGGYILMAAVVLTQQGVQYMLFYLLIYLCMNLGAFFVVILIADKLGSEEIDAYRGLRSRAPIVAVSMSIFLFSLTGIPPFAGFFGKLWLFGAVIEAGSHWYWLAIVGVINSVIALYYYVRVVKAMFLEESSETGSLSISRPHLVLLIIFVIPTILLGYIGQLWKLIPSSF